MGTDFFYFASTAENLISEQRKLPSVFGFEDGFVGQPKIELIKAKIQSLTECHVMWFLTFVSLCICPK